MEGGDKGSEEEGSDYASSDEEEQEDPRDYCKGTSRIARSTGVMMTRSWPYPPPPSPLPLCRRVPPRADRRCVQQKVQGDQEAGLGTLLHCVAVLGRPVSAFKAMVIH